MKNFLSHLFLICFFFSHLCQAANRSEKCTRYLQSISKQVNDFLSDNFGQLAEEERLEKVERTKLTYWYEYTDAEYARDADFLAKKFLKHYSKKYKEFLSKASDKLSEVDQIQEARKKTAVDLAEFAKALPKGPEGGDTNAFLTGYFGEPPQLAPSTITGAFRILLLHGDMKAYCVPPVSVREKFRGI